jgi:hypothetical protein
MFGFLSPRTRIPRWRQSYARVCQFQRRMFGVRSLPFLSYEATFLYQLLIDMQLLPPLPASAPECCRLRRLSNESPVVAASGEFVAAFGLLLAGIKLEDDLRDSGRWYNRFVELLERKPVRAARRWLDTAVPGLVGQVDTILDRHSELEAARNASLISYMKPTGDGFGLLFRASCEHALLSTGQNIAASQSLVAQFEQIGRHIGHAIIAWDCAVDAPRDRIDGTFNPLLRETSLATGYDVARLELARAAWRLPPQSVCAQVLQQVVDRILHRSKRPAPACSPETRERWGWGRQSGFVYARCDVCDACDGCTGCCDGLSCCAEGGNGDCAAGPCLPVWTCCECLSVPCATREETRPQNSDPGNPATAPQGLSPYAHLINTEAVASGDLNPAGYVRCGDQRVPARTALGNFVGSGTIVRIVQADGFGVVVQDS